MTTRANKLKQRGIKINEATGMRVIGQIAIEFWECGWQPFEQRNDNGIDGKIILKRKGEDIGICVNVQSKCGRGYISSETDEVIRLKFPSEDNLIKHKDYWGKQLEPAVLVYTNPTKKKKTKDGNWIEVPEIYKPNSWWVNLKDLSAYPEDTTTIVEIPKKNRFAAHTKSAFMNLVLNQKSAWAGTPIALNDRSQALLKTGNLDRDSKSFYREWSNVGPIFCPPINCEITISRVGWRHITSKSRGLLRGTFSKRYLGAAKQLIEKCEAFSILKRKPIQNKDKALIGETRFIGILGSVNSNLDKTRLIQVILLQKIIFSPVGNETKTWFYSVHERKKI